MLAGRLHSRAGTLPARRCCASMFMMQFYDNRAPGRWRWRAGGWCTCATTTRSRKVSCCMYLRRYRAVQLPVQLPQSGPHGDMLGRALPLPSSSSHDAAASGCYAADGPHDNGGGTGIQARRGFAER
jgi:hypothetical protein